MAGCELHMSTYRPTKTFLLTAEEGRVDNRGGRSEVLGLREQTNPAKTPHSLLTYYWLIIVMFGAPVAGAARAATTGA